MYEEWFDKYGLLHVNKGRDSENGILFTVEYYLLRLLTNELSDEDIKSFKITVAFLKNQDNTFSALPNGGDHWSHDNHTAKCSMEYLLGLNSDIWLKDWYKRVHPRDLIFYWFMTPYIGWMARPFLWIPGAAMVVSCIQTYKTRGDVKMLRTDGKLLTFVRCIATRRKSWTMALTWRLCSWIINKKKQFGSWSSVFSIYFRETDHPNNVLSLKYFK